jgi:hypothetical protein
MTTFRSEVITTGQIVEVDYTNPLSRYLKAAVVPSEGSGDALTELVTGETLNFLPGSLIWNSDGSVSTTEYGNYVETAIKDGSIIFDSSWILQVDYKATYDAGIDARNPLLVVTDRSSGTFRGRDSLGIVTERYDGLSLEVADGYNSSETSFVSNTSQRDVLTIAFVKSNSLVRFYRNNELVLSYNIAGTTGEEWDVGVLLGIGNPAGKFYSACIYNSDQDFTQQEIDSIVADPYQIFKTQEDIQQDSAFVSPASSIYIRVSMPDVNEWTSASELNVLRHRMGFVAGLGSGSGTSTVPLGYGTKFVLRDGSNISNIGSHVINLSSVGVNVRELNKYEVIRSWDGITKISTLFINDEHVETINPSSIGLGNFEYVFAVSSGSLREGVIQALWQYDEGDSTNNRYYDFNQSSEQTFVPELINGQHGVIYGAPLPSGYVRDNDGEILGYLPRTNEELALKTPITFTGDFRVKMPFDVSPSGFKRFISNTSGDLQVYRQSNNTFTFRVNNSNVTTVNYFYNAANGFTWLTVERIDGVVRFYLREDGSAEIANSATNYDGPFEIASLYLHPLENDQPLTHVVIEDLGNPINSLGLDFKSGDADQIIDTVGGNHATIVNAPTSGFLPLVEKQVYTVGTGKDYEDLSSARLALQDPSRGDLEHRLYIFGEVANGITLYWKNSANVGNYTLSLIAATNYFKGLVTLPHLVDTLFYGYTGQINMNLRGMQLQGSRFLTNNNFANYVTIEDSYLDTNFRALVSDFTNTITTVKNSVIAGCATSIDRGTPLYIYDSILWNNGGTYGDWGVINFEETVVKNSIFGFDENRVNPSTTIRSFGSRRPVNLESSHNVTYDDVNPDGAVLMNVDANDVLVDPSNGDFRVKKSYAEAINPLLTSGGVQEYYLDFSAGADARVNIPEAIPIGSTSFRIDFDWAPTALTSGYNPILSNDEYTVTPRNAIYQRFNGELEVAFIIGGSRAKLDTSGAGLQVGVRKTLTVIYNGSTLSALIDSVPVGSVGASGAVGGSSGVTVIGDNAGENSATMHLYGVYFQWDGSEERNYSPTASIGTGQVLPDTVGGNDGTLVNFPTDNSQWKRLYANLKDQGWNGTDIAGWAYYDDTVVTPPTVGGVSVSTELSSIVSILNTYYKNSLNTVNSASELDILLTNEYNKSLSTIVASSAQLSSLFNMGRYASSNLGSMTSTEVDSLKNTIHQFVNEVNSRNEHVVEGSKLTSTLLEAVTSLNVIKISNKFTNLQTLSASDISILTKAQKILAIVTDAVGVVNVEIVSDTIKALVLAITTSAEADASNTVLAAKVVSILETSSSYTINNAASKAAERGIEVSSVITESLYASKAIAKTMEGYVESNNRVTLSKGLPTSIISSASAEYTNGISVHKELTSTLLNSIPRTSIAVDLNKGMAIFVDESIANSTEILINKEIGTLTVKSNGVTSVLTLNNFTDSNVVVVNQGLLYPSTTITDSVEVQDRVINTVIRIK